jgi:serine/threonine protein kinase
MAPSVQQFAQIYAQFFFHFSHLLLLKPNHHRPKNVLFKKGSFEGMVKLTDFGLSKGLDTNNLDQTFSTTTVQGGEEIGSFGYYAPEVYRHENPTAKVDIFSLGCCIFYVLSDGANPFQNDDQPDNKFYLNANILTGKSNLAAIARAQGRQIPEAVDLVSHMIDMEAGKRPPMVQILEHPLFWSDVVAFDFLCAVGKEEDVVGNSAGARAALPPSLLPKSNWRKLIDEEVWAHYTEGDYGRSYDVCSTSHLLRFMRNSEAHPPPHNSKAQTVLAKHGGMATYFVSRCFPQLALQVRTALVEREEWRSRSTLQRFLHARYSSASTGAGAGSRATGGWGGIAPGATVPKAPSMGTSTKGRLEQIDSLKSEGMITEAEYNEKRQAILASI